MTKEKLLLTKKEYSEMIDHESEAAMKNGKMMNWVEIWSKYEEQASFKWGGWYFGKEHLTLDLLETPHEIYTHKNPFYQIDLEIDSSAEMLDWIFQINGKNLHNYGITVCQDLINAFHEIFKPQQNCCSMGINKSFDGRKIAIEYKNLLIDQKLKLGDRI